jgi:hypothetical protein
MAWRPLKDKFVLHRWKCVCDGRNDPEGIKWDSSSYTVEVGPDWYEQNGTPTCVNCERDMEYIETLIDCLKDPISNTYTLEYWK